MNATQIERRTFLKMGLLTASAAVLTGCKVGASYEAQCNLARSFTSSDPVKKRLVQYATLAPNSHNSQPWQFLLTDEGIEIHPDQSRHLSAVDPDDRELWISLGCALENMTLAAAAEGFECEVIYPDSVQRFIKVNLNPSTIQKHPLFSAIPLRQSNRSIYLEKSVDAALIDQIHAVQCEMSVSMQLLDGKPALERIVEFVNKGNLLQFSNKAFMDELISWLRFNKKEALTTRDGLFTKCTGNPAVPRWMGEIFVSGTKPQAQADADAKKLLSSAGAVIIATASDDLADWVRCGQVYERLSLTLTSLGLSNALLNQPIEEPSLRDQFAEVAGLKGAIPQLLVRYGYAEPMVYSLRRQIEDVILD